MLSQPAQAHRIGRQRCPNHGIGALQEIDSAIDVDVAGAIRLSIFSEVMGSYARPSSTVERRLAGEDLCFSDRDAFARLDWQYASQNHWLTSAQDPNSVQYSPYVLPLSSTKFASLRAGMSFGNASVALFVDNLFDSRQFASFAGKLWERAVGWSSYW